MTITRRSKTFLAHAYRLLCRTEIVLAAALLILMVVLIFTGGVARMARHPINWTVDFSTCFFAWATFLCADIAWRHNALIGVELVSAGLSERAKRWLVSLNLLIIIAFLIYIAWFGTKLAMLSSARSFQGIPWISYSWVTMSLPVGAMLLTITALLKFRAAIIAPAATADTPAERKA